MDDKRDRRPLSATGDPKVREGRHFLRFAILFYGVGLAFFLTAAAVWYAADVLLLAFACVLVAILLYDMTSRVREWLGIRRVAALALVVLLLTAVIGSVGWLLAPQVIAQTADLTSAIPQAINRLREEAQQNAFLRTLVGSLPPTEQIISRGVDLMVQSGLGFSGILGAIGDTAIIILVGIYLAAQPYVYIEGIVTLVPHRKKQRVREVFTELGETLGQWLVGKFITMLIVGVATSIGLILLDVPLGLVLGILAGILDFIPYIGPVLAGGPAILIAFADSPTLALYVALLFFFVQISEGYLLLPLIERRTVSLPPALTIVMQVLLGAIFGLAGVALATPLTATLAVLVAMLYVQDVLGDPVKTPSGN